MNKDWNGPNYLKSYPDSRRLAEKVKEYYRHSGFFDKIKTWVEHDGRSDVYVVRSNISELMESTTMAEEKAGL